jgi:23S rRNA maturation-related 3'-5' exoribonuclease YhaM
MEKIDSLLRKNLTIRGYELYTKLREKIPDIWSRPSSSTGKHHRKEDEGGRVPDQAEHIFEMLFAADRIIELFGKCNKDVIFLSIVMHDAFKYGKFGDNPHTEYKHDQIIGDTIKNSRNLFLKLLNEKEVVLLENMVRYHSGRWSTDAGKDFSFYEHEPEILFIHVLDMLSTKNVIKVTQRNNEVTV